LEKWGIGEQLRKSDERISPKKLVLMSNPFNQAFDEKVVLLPAINPDVTIIHVQKVDRNGNVRIEGLTFSDVEQAKASTNLIVTCEEVCEVETLRSLPQLNQLPSFFPDAVVELSKGAHPTQCYNYYDLDSNFLYAVIEASKNDATLSIFLEEYIFGVTDHEQYLEKIGRDVFYEITADPGLGYKSNLNRKDLRDYS
jgi:glutaconate CoA-transferase subunit A